MRIFFISLLLTMSCNVFSIKFEAGNSGGSGGSPFFDNPPANYESIHSIQLCGGARVDSIEVKYEDTVGNINSYGKHGGKGGSCSVLNFWSGEYVTRVSGRHGSRIDSLRITTNYNRVLSKGGKGGSSTFNYTGNLQFQIAGLKGRSGKELDSIGVVYLQAF